ncbi:MAG: hypothetical protein WBZ19_13015 [Chthoniobacterales bacterium]
MIGGRRHRAESSGAAKQDIFLSVSRSLTFLGSNIIQVIEQHFIQTG